MWCPVFYEFVCGCAWVNGRRKKKNEMSKIINSNTHFPLSYTKHLINLKLQHDDFEDILIFLLFFTLTLARFSLVVLFRIEAEGKLFRLG
jgi:hypothetical protein